MNDNVSAAVDKDASLAEVLDAYLAGLHAGTAPSQEELLARYPDLAGDLKECLASLAFIRQAAVGSNPANNAPTDGDLPGTLGDFRIHREIGRGGMGVLYEAEQISLRRRVALKVLPFAATLDPRRLQRFHTEAQAAAHLHHQNIVPVYAVGCERGVHYYAMQYIEGQTLATGIRDLRRLAGLPVPEGEAAEKPTAPERPAADTAPPTSPIAGLSTERSTRSPAYFRTIAHLAVQAAEALEHAHQLGVVHRDVKPANLLVDVRGNLWIADFGLAYVQGGPGLTMTGDVVGTLRYMSPEQALAKRVTVDHRTDIYSLGVTLYELLALETPFPAQDRQELLRQITFEEPRRLRRLNKAIPAELETIVLKAMQKNPGDRYATAQEVADDLRRFLEDRPIQARRPSTLARGLKWARRHRPVVWAAAVCLLVALAAGVGSAAWILGERAARQEEAEAKVQEALAEAMPRLSAGNPDDPALIAAVQRAEAQLGAGELRPLLRGRVEQLRRDQKMLADLEQASLQTVAGDNETGMDFDGADRLYAQAFAGYGMDVTTLSPQEAAQRLRASAISPHLIAGLDDWAFVRDNLSRGSGAAVRRVAELADDDPWRRRRREAAGRRDRATLEELAEEAETLSHPPANLVMLARVLRNGGSGVVAERLLRRAQSAQPADFWVNLELAETLYKKKPPDMMEAVRFYQAALALRPQSPVVHNNLGNALQHQGKRVETEAAYRKAIELKPNYAFAHCSLGNALREQGKRAEAEAAYRKTIALKPDYAIAYYNLGIVLLDQKKLAEAVAAFRKTIELKPDYPEAHNNLGVTLQKEGKLAEAVAALRRAIELKPDHPEAHNNLGVTLQKEGKLAEAEAAFRKAIQLKVHYGEAYSNLGISLVVRKKLPEAVAAFRRAVELQPGLPVAHNNLGNALREQGKLPEAVAAFRRAIELKPDYPEAHNNLSVTMQNQGKLAEAEAASRQAIALMPDYGEAHCVLGHALCAQGRYVDALAALKRGHALGSRNPRWAHPSAQWVQQCERLVELDRKLRAIMSGKEQPADAADRIALADLCQLPCKKRYAVAVGFYSEAFAAEPKWNGDRPSGPRYRAACAATLAGCGQGQNADKLDTKARARLRQQALDWLRADLAAWAKVLERDRSKAATVVRLLMQHWLKGPDFTGVRGAEALSRLPEDERPAWQRLWADVADLLARADGKPEPEK
jgi:serine/threonine protein kinase/Tfp pilus assembly protein PilF